MKMINYLFVAILFPLSLIVAPKPTAQAAPKKLKLWYNKPAKYFEEALVLGNGTQGSTVFSGSAAVAKMLVQSTNDLLPALAKAWPSGKLFGFYKCSHEWRNQVD